VPSCDRRDVIVFYRQELSNFLKFMLLFRPNMRKGDIEPENAAVHCLGELRELLLQRLALLSLFATHPVGELGDDDRAGVTVILFLLQPRDHARMAFLFGGLIENVGIQEPAHSLRVFGYSRRRTGRSSMSTGQAFRTASQSAFLAIRRKTMAPSSGSNSAMKWSPGFAGARFAGTVRRRFASRDEYHRGLPDHDTTSPTQGADVVAVSVLMPSISGGLVPGDPIPDHT
jgi:hypothetical protein